MSFFAMCKKKICEHTYFIILVSAAFGLRLDLDEMGMQVVGTD